MADGIITKQELIDAKVDAQTLEDCINGAPDTKVTARLGRQYWTLATLDGKLNYVQTVATQIQEVFDGKISELETQAQSTINEWQNAITLITANDGVPALAVADASGKSQQEINDFGGAEWRNKPDGYKLGATVKLTNGDIVKSTIANNTVNPNVDMTGWAADVIKPELFGAYGDGVTSDSSSFYKLAASKPSQVEASPNATYILDNATPVIFTDSCVFNGNGCTIIMDQRWNIRKTPMWGSSLSEAAVKGQTVLKIGFTTDLKVGSEVLIFQSLGLSGSEIDPYFLSVSGDVDNGDYSSHVNYIKAVDTVAKTITLAIPLKFNAPVQTAVYATDTKKLTFVNVNFVLRGDASNFRMIDNCCNVEFISGSISQDATQDNSTALRINTCKDVTFIGTKLKSVNIALEYGSYNCSVRSSQGVSTGHGDAMVMIWCAATRCYTENNNFFAGEKLKPGSITAGVYLGAKTRDCWSDGDLVDGLPYGFRAQWGAVNPKFTGVTAKNITTFSLFSDYTHNLQVLSSKLYDKPLRTIGVYSLVLQNNLLDSGWRGEAVEIPLMLDLNRNEANTVREGYTIQGNTVIGSARSWLALSKSTFTNNTMISLRFVNAGVMQNTYFNGNNFGNFYAQNVVNCGFTNNTVDHAILELGTLTGSDVAAVHFYAQTVVNMTGNTIKHPTCGVKRTTPPASQVNCIAVGGGNNIIAPTQWDTGVDDTTAPTIGTSAAYLSRGLEYKSNVAGSKIVWRYNGSSWIKGFLENPQLTYSQSSFPNTMNGLTTFTTTRNIVGAAVGDTVIVSTTSADIGELKGKYFARVTAPDTVTVYYQDRSGVSEAVPPLSITLTLIKS